MKNQKVISKKRCRHLNAELLESAEEWISHLFEDGEYVDSTHEAGEITRTFRVECNDCGKVFYFSSFGKCPKWVEKMRRQIAENAKL